MGDAVQNPFATAEGARRYQRGRPFHHRRALDKVFAVTGVHPVGRALDVACGTGLSTLALSDRADLTIGVDSVQPTIRLAQPTATTLFAVSEAEQLPFSSGTFDLVTVSSGVHWFNQRVFFAEAARVLVPRGWLAIYDHFFEGCRDEPEIDIWLRHEYAKRYPPPPRAARGGREMLVADDFLEMEAFEYDDPISFTHDQLVAYLLSHSNTISPATEGRETAVETEMWLRSGTASWFEPRDLRTFSFRPAGRCLRRKSY